MKGKSKSLGSGKKFNPYMIPVMFILCVIPLIVHLKEYDTHLEDYDFFASETFPDFYLYYKALFFILTCTVMVILIAARFIRDRRNIECAKLFIPLAGYALLSLLSAIFSKTPIFCFNGIFEQFESVWVLLGYAVTVYYCFLFVATEKDVDRVMIAFMVGTIIMLLIGVSQAFSKDLYRSTFGRYLILPTEYWSHDEIKLEFAFPLGQVYLTLYNPNYVGSYVALIAPVFLMYGFAKKKIWMIILNVCIYVGLLWTILGSGSRAGLIGVAFSLLLLGILFSRKLLKFIPEVIIILVIIIGTIYTYNNYNNNAPMNRLKQALDITKTEYNLTAIETNDDDIVFHYKDYELKLSQSIDLEAGTFTVTFKDQFDKEIPYTTSDNETEGGIDFALEDNRYKNFSVRYIIKDMIPYFLTKVDGRSWNFCYYNNTYYYGNNKGKMAKINNAEYNSFLNDYSKLFSGRGFIWSRTLPLLKKTIFLGTGPDTFLVNFPNDDYVAMTNGGYGDELMTKPHNMYLQIAVQTGVLSLICFLVFYFWYFVSSFRLYFKSRENSFIKMVGIGILCGTFGYMVVGIINDSMVCIAPLYWTLIGIGLAINRMLKKQQAVQETASDTREVKKAVSGKSEKEKKEIKAVPQENSEPETVAAPQENSGSETVAASQENNTSKKSSKSNKNNKKRK